jgi:hypothetical protein
MESDYKKINKSAASNLTTISEAIRELAWTEAGESDHPTIQFTCAALLRQAGILDAAILVLKMGDRPTMHLSDDDIPF